jgi:hypothetical protein
MERETGMKRGHPAWKAGVLRLNYSRWDFTISSQKQSCKFGRVFARLAGGE